MTTLCHAPAARLDPYASIHKGLRALLADSLLALGQLDARDDTAVRATVTRLLSMLAFCRAHGEHEDRFLHPPLEARAPGASSASESDHAQHLRAIAQIEQAAQALVALPPVLRRVEIHALYRRLALFMAHTLEHLEREESVHNVTLWACYTDAEIASIHDALVAAIDPGMALFGMRWMLPAVDPCERSALMRQLRASAPPAAVEAVLQAVREALSPAEWRQLARNADAEPDTAAPIPAPRAASPELAH